MNRTELAALQERILDGCKAAGLAAGRMPTDRELADVAGVDPSIVSHWRRGRREAGLAELVRLADRYGAGAVWAPLSERSAPASPLVPLRDAVPAGLAAVRDAAMFTASIDAALADGRITDEEAEGLQLQHDHAVAGLHRALLAIQDRRRSA